MVNVGMAFQVLSTQRVSVRKTKEVNKGSYRYFMKVIEIKMDASAA
jgi:hypothetical protein